MADDSGSDVFNALVDDYSSLTSSISKKISAIPTKTIEQKLPIINELDGNFREAQDSIKSMEVELRTLDPKSKAKYGQMLKQFQADLQNLRKDFERLKNDANREFLFDGARDGANTKSSDQRARLLDVTAQEDQNTKRLRAARRELDDIENQGADTMQDLRRQRDVLQKIEGNVGEAESLYGRVRHILNRMGRRNVYMALMWCFIGIVLIIAIVCIIYFKWVKN
eukprot:TRINITY_DN1453_c0_g1_i1.p1 TRINITY_DN1453_c0_g1~~TRINITY_DN1453_c0_g1_i1.p1  ORF type:complete len:240 (+),score=87.90 TRINITY_DN1453_c0_g1_i1:50-721(+)